MDSLQVDLFGDGDTYDEVGATLHARMSGHDRRSRGITLTPQWLVELMLQRLTAYGPFDNVVDAGAGSGRFTMQAARLFPGARIWAVERSEDMCGALRANLAAQGLQHRVQVLQGDYRDVAIPLSGRTAFVGNPPFVRHHDIEPAWKRWYAAAMAQHGQRASQLAGLHLHFMARTAVLARPGDRVCWVTSAEWLDNGYGSAWRHLLSASNAPLSLTGLWVASPGEPVFPDALVSALVFEAVCGGAVAASVGTLAGQALHTARVLPSTQLAAATRWTALCQTELDAPAAGIELGELFRVTRGQVTGLNKAWMLAPGSALLPPQLTLAAVTKAREIIDGTVERPDALACLRRLPNLPADLSQLPDSAQVGVAAYLSLAHAQGAANGYVARQRRAWYALDLRAAPAAMVSYMGRRPPVFRTNPHGVSYLNIAHGLYPRQEMPAAQLQRVLDHLNTHTRMGAGRMYGGGMAKFEPSDIARLRIPGAVLEPAA